MTKMPIRIATLVACLTLAAALPATAQGRTEVVKNIPEVIVGAPIGSCGAFNVLADWSALFQLTLYYDKDGSLIREKIRYRVIGQSRYYNSSDPDIAVAGGPGEIQNNRWDYVNNTYVFSGNSWKIKLPGYGTILHETGRTVYDLATGTLQHDTGHNQFNEQDFAALCKALTP